MFLGLKRQIHQKNYREAQFLLLIKGKLLDLRKIVKNVRIYRGCSCEEAPGAECESAKVSHTLNVLPELHTYLPRFLHSIQTVSLWVIHHRRHFKTIVAVWLREMRKVSQSKKLTFMYLANDIIQNSKKKGPEYGKEFSTTLKDAFAHVAEACTGEDIFNRLDRILSIWEERGVYEAKQIKEWFNALHSISGSSSSAVAFRDNNGAAGAEAATAASSTKKRKNEEPKHAETPDKKVRTSKDGAKTETVEVNGTVETHITLSPHMPQECDPPEPEVLIKFLQSLENSASSDATVREKIANLPPEVSEMSLLAKLTDKEAAIKLAVQVNDAIALLNEYNGRLADEMVERKKLTTMLRDFQTEQTELLAHAEQRLAVSFIFCTLSERNFTKEPFLSTGIQRKVEKSQRCAEGSPQSAQELTGNSTTICFVTSEPRRSF